MAMVVSFPGGEAFSDLAEKVGGGVDGGFLFVRCSARGELDELLGSREPARERAGDRVELDGAHAATPKIARPKVGPTKETRFATLGIASDGGDEPRD